jgi:dipeptidyl aminopeptidase/acylaminoacyl peptidase
MGLMRGAVLAMLGVGPGLGFGCAAMAAQPVSVRDLARVVHYSDPQFSPDGKTIAVVETLADLEDDEYRQEIWLVDRATHALRPLTRDRHHAGSPRWSPAGDAIAFIAPDRDKVSQVFILPMNGGDALPLTHVKKDNDVQQFAWSPDGKQIAYVANDPKPELKGEDKHRDAFQIGNDDFTLTEKPRPAHVWLVAAAGGEARRLTGGAWSLPSSLPPGSPSSPLKWLPDGKSLLIVRQESPSTGDQLQTRIEVLDVATGGTRFLTGDADLEGYPVPSPDGHSVAYWRQRDGKPWNFQDVWVVPFAGGGAADVSAALDKNVFGTFWMPDGKTLLVGGNDGTTVGLWALPAHSAARRIDLGGVMPTNGYWMDVDVDRAGSIAFIGQTARDPFELFLVAPGHAPEQLTSGNAGLADLVLGRSETVQWPGPGGRSLDGVVTYPADFAAGRKYPLVLLIHGGPNSSSRERFSLLPQLLAARGSVVFEPNYRGSDNAGNAFYAAIYRDTGQGPGEDVKSGVDYLVSRGGIDTARLGVSGWSYGGFMTTWMLGHYDIWKVAVAGAAVTDWVDMYNLSDGNVTISAEVGGSPYVGDGMANYRRQSPDSMVAKIKAPTLIMCDTGDFRVPITQSFGLFRALKDNHVETEFYAIPTGGHFPGDPIRQMEVYQRWSDWIAKYL